MIPRYSHASLRRGTALQKFVELVTPRLMVAALVGVLAPLSVAPAQERTVVLGGREVVVWSPHGATTTKQPVIIFSHGFGGCATQSRFLTEALAERGYWVFAPNHKDASCGRSDAMTRPEEPFQN